MWINILYVCIHTYQNQIISREKSFFFFLWRQQNHEVIDSGGCLRPYYWSRPWPKSDRCFSSQSLTIFINQRGMCLCLTWFIRFLENKWRNQIELSSVQADRKQEYEVRGGLLLLKPKIYSRSLSVFCKAVSCSSLMIIFSQLNGCKSRAAEYSSSAGAGSL